MASSLDPGEARLSVRLGQQAVERGWMTPDQLREALTEQAHAAAAGRPVARLEEILISRGFLTAPRLEELRSASESAARRRIVEPESPGLLGKFRIEGVLGRGGMGIVYRARDTELQRDVALKTLLPSPIDDPDAWVEDEQRFLREARLAAGLPFHPNIVPVYEAGVIEGRRYMASALVEGRPMTGFFGEGPEGLRRWITLLRDAALAVHHAHEHGIIHRDLKPENILVDASGRPHITDFGLAKASGSRGSASLTGAGHSVGTPAYMSPEQADGTRPVDRRTDVYALGVMLYEGLTARRPFDAGSALQTLVQAAVQPVTPPTQTPRPGLRVENIKPLERICLKALAKDPDARYAGARELAEDLDRWLAGGPAAADLRRPALPRVLAAAMLIGIAAVMAVILLREDETPAPPPPPPPPPVPAVLPDPHPPAPKGAAYRGRNPQGFHEYAASTDGAVMILIPAGEFVMGFEQGANDERPQRKVRLDSYLIDRTEVTVGQYRKFIEATGHVTEAEKAGVAFIHIPNGYYKKAPGSWKNPGYPLDEQLPVTCVSWADAAAYCAWAGRRLPTEAEWEKAARGADGRRWPWGNAAEGERAGVRRDASGPHQVGSFPQGASPYGVLDLAGNVTEFCADWYDAAFYAKGENDNPKGPAEGQLRVFRSGSWVDPDVNLVRSVRRNRGYSPKWGPNNADGFRCARDFR